jgi:hypothetical protein
MEILAPQQEQEVTFRKTLEITKDVHEEQKEDVPSFGLLLFQQFP